MIKHKKKTFVNAKLVDVKKDDTYAENLLVDTISEKSSNDNSDPQHRIVTRSFQQRMKQPNAPFSEIYFVNQRAPNLENEIHDEEHVEIRLVKAQRGRHTDSTAGTVRPSIFAGINS